MILHIPDLLAAAFPGRFAGERLTVAAVYTTRPKYLVFGGDRAKPICVVDEGRADETERRFALLQRMHAVLPRLIAEPIGCIPFGTNRALHVQGGLAGMPWFALGRIYRSPAEWRQVIERAVSALGAFQSGVGEISEWSGPLSIGDELRRQADLADSTIGLRDATRALVASRGRALDGLSASRWPWQHGDFSLNNLLIARDEISIIDLEDLGATSVPLHDEIGLALSIRLAAPQASLPTAECLALCTSASAARHGFSRAQVDGLLLHHLLWRINACGEWSRRRALLDILVDLLNRFTDNPGEFLAPEADGSEIWLHRRVHA